MANKLDAQKQELEAQKEEVQPTEGVERTRPSRVYVPRADIYSTDEGVEIVADMPGIDEKSIDITLEKDILEINGYVEPPEQLRHYELAYAEYGIGDYQRRFSIPDEVDRNNIQASVSHGVLRVRLPKAPEAQAKKITVRAG